jgi:hypothetical protein
MSGQFLNDRNMRAWDEPGNVTYLDRGKETIEAGDEQSLVHGSLHLRLGLERVSDKKTDPASFTSNPGAVRAAVITMDNIPMMC